MRVCFELCVGVCVTQGQGGSKPSGGCRETAAPPPAEPGNRDVWETYDLRGDGGEGEGDDREREGN